MYLKRVVLNNIKGFSRVDLDLCPDGASYPGWSVITGDNGTGKTALLRAIALAVLGPDQARDVVSTPESWVTAGRSKGTVSVEIKSHNEFDRTLRGGQPYRRGIFWAEIEIGNEQGVWGIDATDVFRRKRKGAANGPWPETTPGWFIVGYGPFRRLYGASQDGQRVMYRAGRAPRFATLFLEGATLGAGEEWIQHLEFARLDYEYRGRADKRDDASALENLLRLIGDDFLRHGVKVHEIDSEAIWLRDALDRRVSLSDMSEGYRAAIAMLVDIFRHLIAVYGPNIVEHSDDHGHFVTSPGVVMIDEVDAHLHPDWQRDIGFWLQRHFPHIQFIVTTHSPLVCAAADNGRIYHLPDPETGERPFRLSSSDYQKVVAGKPDEILLTPAFGMKNTRSPRAVEARRRHALLLSKRLSLGRLSSDEEEELDQLRLFITPPEA